MSIMCHTDGSKSQSNGFIALRVLTTEVPLSVCG